MLMMPAFQPFAALSTWTRAYNAGLSPPGQTGEGLGNAHDAGLPASRRHLKPEGVTDAHDTLAAGLPAVRPPVKLGKAWLMLMMPAFQPFAAL